MNDEQKKPGRPNEGVALSNDPPEGEELHFYYSRSRRLSRAPANVRALYEETPAPKFSLIRPLVSGRPNAILFGTMAVLALIMLAVSFFGLADGAQDYYGNRISLSAVRYEGAAILTLKKTRRDEGAAYAGPLDIAVSPLGGEAGAPYPSRINLSSRSSEEFRFSVPFEESQFLVRISHEGAEEGSGLAFRIKTR
ncbi:MAG: hypothetical protein LBI94_07170 [Treponema sp.]|jgi:hypothetical protein|nr:hypothetical protein [Treponema sp.]